MVVVTKDYFYINGVRCDTVGLSCDTPPIPAMAVQNYTEWVTGADTPKASPDGTFQNVQYTLTAYVFLNDVPHDNTAVYAYLAEARTLTISRLPEYYFKVLKVNGITPTVKYDGRSIAYKISLTLAPFRYFINNAEIAVDYAIENPGNRYSRPLYKVTNRSEGATDLSLIVNGQIYALTGLTDSDAVIYIDAEKLLCYSKVTENSSSTVNLMPKSTGQIPFLNTGQNACRVTDGALTVTGNWRSY